METKVSWNADYLNLRTRLVNKMEGAAQYGMRTEDFESVVRECVGSVVMGPALKRNVRDLMKDADVRISLGKSHVRLYKMLSRDIQEWQELARAGADAHVAEMKRTGASELMMCSYVFRKEFLNWRDNDYNYLAVVKERFQVCGYSMQMHGGQVMVRKLPSQETVPTFCKHTVSSLLDILTKPTLTVKRRWSKGLTHAVSVDDDVALFLDSDVFDENNISTDRVIIERGEVLLVNAPALEILQASAQEAKKEMMVKSLI